jgi:hypothetical protein
MPIPAIPRLTRGEQVANTLLAYPRASEHFWGLPRVVPGHSGPDSPHYVSVLIGLADLRPRWDQLKLPAAGLVIVGCVLFWIILSYKQIFFN